VQRRINNTDRAALITTDKRFLERWRNSGLDQRQFIIRHKKEIDRALIADPVFSGTHARPAPPPPLAPSERRDRVLEALSRIEEATAACKLVPTKQSKQELDRAIRDFGRMWFDVKRMIDTESEATEGSTRTQRPHNNLLSIPSQHRRSQ
jgi:hypothetical protein